MKIVRADESTANPGPAEWFSGRAWMEDRGAVGASAPIRVLCVTFEPRARTAWHTHPQGQILQILFGSAWVQSEGRPRRELGPGDSVGFAPGERHWHGASPRGPMSHLAVQPTDPELGQETLWAEQVTDSEYEAESSAEASS